MKNITYIIMIIIAYFCGYYTGLLNKKVVREVLPSAPIHDTISIEIPVPKIVLKEIPEKVDTAAILAMYYSEKSYRDTLIDMPELKVEVADMISQNSLIDRRVVVNYNPPERPRYNAISASAYIANGTLPVLIGYRHKRFSYNIGYDIINRAAVCGLSYDLAQW